MPLIELFDFIIFLIDVTLVPLIFAVSLIVFLWGIYNYFILGAGNDEKRKEGRTFVVYGIIGFFIMVSVWGIVNLFVYTFGFDRDTRPPLPSFGETSGNYGDYGDEGDFFNGNGGDDFFAGPQDDGDLESNTGEAPSDNTFDCDLTPQGCDGLGTDQSHGSCGMGFYCQTGTCVGGQCYDDGT